MYFLYSNGASARLISEQLLYPKKETLILMLLLLEATKETYLSMNDFSNVGIHYFVIYSNWVGFMGKSLCIYDVSNNC